MPTISIPANSFVQQFGTDTESACAESVTTCLPVLSETDVAFQFMHTGSFICGFQAQIYVDGDPHGSPKDIIAVAITDAQLGYLPDLSDMGFDTLPDATCFTIRISSYSCDEIPEIVVLWQSACFQKIYDACWTSVIKYRCNEDSFGFNYSNDYSIGPDTFQMYNIVRLPFYLTEPQPVEKDNVFTLSDGTKKLLSSRIEMEYQALTDYMPKKWHERLVVARSHDEFYVENVNAGYAITQAFCKAGGYEIDWQRFLDYPTAPAKFKLIKTPYNNVNSNCS